jgi:hypothetical protein
VSARSLKEVFGPEASSGLARQTCAMNRSMGRPCRGDHGQRPYGTRTEPARDDDRRRLAARLPGRPPGVAQDRHDRDARHVAAVASQAYRPEMDVRGRPQTTGCHRHSALICDPRQKWSREVRRLLRETGIRVGGCAAESSSGTPSVYGSSACSCKVSPDHARSNVAVPRRMS